MRGHANGCDETTSFTTVLKDSNYLCFWRNGQSNARFLDFVQFLKKKHLDILLKHTEHNIEKSCENSLVFHYWSFNLKWSFYIFCTTFFSFFSIVTTQFGSPTLLNSQFVFTNEQDFEVSKLTFQGDLLDSTRTTFTLTSRCSLSVIFEIKATETRMKSNVHLKSLKPTQRPQFSFFTLLNVPKPMCFNYCRVV